MKRIDTATKAVDLFGAGKHGFRAGNVLAGESPTKLNSPWFNHVQEELANLVEVLFGEALDDGTVNQLATLFAAKFATLAPLEDAALTGVPTAPTQDPGNNSTRIANTAFVQAAIAALVDSSPGALDTLNELAAALGNDPNFATTITNLIATKLGLAGGALTDFLTLHADPTANLHAATKQYADALVAAISAATTGTAGLVELLTTAEFNAGTDATRAMVAANFTKSIAANGYIKLPGGVLIQWGKTANIANVATVNINFPVSFATAVYIINVTPEYQGSGTSYSSWATPNSLSQMSVGQNNGASIAAPLFWVAIGK